MLDALVIEALVQAISSAAFVVPGALGVQEGGFLLIGAALGIDGTTALALAAARRLRDVIVFFPGLIAWQWAETRIRSVRSASASGSHSPTKAAPVGTRQPAISGSAANLPAAPAGKAAPTRACRQATTPEACPCSRCPGGATATGCQMPFRW